jgi:hypothetical protein
MYYKNQVQMQMGGGIIFKKLSTIILCNTLYNGTILTIKYRNI